MSKRYILSHLFLLFFLIFIFCSRKISNEPREASDKSGIKKSKIVLLGTGTPNAEPDRSGTSIAIVVGEVSYIVDFGPGIVRRASAASTRGIEALKPQNLRIVFLTHLHSDHTTGYPDLIFTPWVLGRDRPLQVFGPPGIKAMTENILKAYEEDVRVRIEGLEPANTEGYKVQAHEIEEGDIFEDENVRVKSFLVEHGSWNFALGFRFDTPERVIVISGDTRPSKNLIENAKGCDVLIHEVYSLAWFAKQKPEWQRYHSAFHTSSRELAEIAQKIRPRLLILYHQLFRGFREKDLLKEIRKYYKGKVVFGHDLDIY